MNHEEKLAELINKADLCKKLSISVRGLEYLVKRGEFPPPVKIGKYVYWSEVAVMKWKRRLFAIQEVWEPRI